MKVQTAYDRFVIMPTLQEHMLRVGAVATIFCKNVPSFEYSNELISACLLHDMGNIVKFDLDNVPKGLDIGDVDYWKQVQQDVITEYGSDEHDVTHDFAIRIGVSEKTLHALRWCGTSNVQKVLSEKDMIPLLVTYCDYHVAPTKIVTVQQRMEDILVRYKDSVKYEGYKAQSECIYAMADFVHDTFGFDEGLITQNAVDSLVEEMREWELV